MRPAAGEVAAGTSGWVMSPRRHDNTDSGIVKRSLDVQMKGIDPWMIYQDVGGSLR